MAPLLIKHKLTPRSAEELVASGRAGERSNLATFGGGFPGVCLKYLDFADASKSEFDYTSTIQGWRAYFPSYIDDFHGLESLCEDAEDLVRLQFLTEHEHAAIRFLEEELHDETRAESGAQLVEYLESSPTELRRHPRLHGWR